MIANVACTLRRINASSWEIVSDAAHCPIGAASVEIVSQSFLRLHYDFTATQIHTSHVTLDETFAKYDPCVRVGQSVGLNYLDVYLYRGASQTPIDPGLFSAAGANLWVSGLFSVAGPT